MNEIDGTPIKTTSTSSKKLFLTIFFLLLLGIAIYIISTDSSKKIESNNSPAPAPQTQYTADFYENFLIGKATLKFPTISSQTKIEENQLPAELQKLILEGKSLIEISKLTYSDKKSGYNIKYLLPNQNFDDLTVKFNTIFIEGGGTLVDGKKTELANILEYTYKTYQVRVMASTEKPDSQVQISINIYRTK